MFAYLVLLFTILPAVELAILIKIGAQIGVGNTLTVIILTGVVGAYLARIQGFTVLSKIQASLNRGNMPTEEMLDGVMIFVGGIVLLTPGFITDALGLILLIPWTRDIIKYLARKRMQDSISSGNVTAFHTSYSNYQEKNDNQDYEDADFH